MTRHRTLVHAIIAIAMGTGGLLSSNSLGHAQHPVLKNCPLYGGPNRSWKSYFNNVQTGSWAYVIFEDKKTVPADRPWNNACVTFLVRPGSAYPDRKHRIAVRAFLNDWPYKYHFEETPSGQDNVRWDGKGYQRVTLVHAIPDLAKSQIAVWKDIFTYDDDGAVYHKEYGRVGSLTCFIPPPTSPCFRGKIPTGKFFFNPLGGG